jgi:hypothetical protein
MCFQKTRDVLRVFLTEPNMAYYQTNPYGQPLIAARQELEQRRQELDALQQRISWLENSIAALEPLAAGEPAHHFGNLGEILRAVLSNNPGRPMTVSEIIYVIDAMGIKFKNPKNTSATLGVTLRRMALKPDSGIVWVPAPVLGKPVRFVWNDAVPKPPSDLTLVGQI